MAKISLQDLVTLATECRRRQGLRFRLEVSTPAGASEDDNDEEGERIGFQLSHVGGDLVGEPDSIDED